MYVNWISMSPPPGVWRTALSVSRVVIVSKQAYALALPPRNSRCGGRRQACVTRFTEVFLHV